jgi:hypothetical protein
MELDLITVAIFVALAFYIGWFCRGISIMQNLAERPEHMIALLEEIRKINEQEAQSLPTDIIEMNVEKQNGAIYLFNKTTGDFLAQGASIEDAVKIAAERFPGKRFGYTDAEQTARSA